jgi:glucose-1-phosphate thymidylyltransferase
VRVVEKPKVPPTNLAVIGIYFFDQKVFKAVDSIQPSARGELEITDTIQWLIDTGCPVQADAVRGYWIDTGKMTDILEANRMVLDTLEPQVSGHVDDASRVEGKVVIEEGATVANSVIRGPAIIGRNTRIVDSYVGPFTSIYHDCLLLNSEVSSSIVLEHTTIEAVGHRIEESMIGRNVELFGGNIKPRAYRLTLGDHSRIHAP